MVYSCMGMCKTSVIVLRFLSPVTQTCKKCALVCAKPCCVVAQGTQFKLFDPLSHKHIILLANYSYRLQSTIAKVQGFKSKKCSKF